MGLIEFFFTSKNRQICGEKKNSKNSRHSGKLEVSKQLKIRRRTLLNKTVKI
jgi:hypothetical protein